MVGNQSGIPVQSDHGLTAVEVMDFDILPMHKTDAGSQGF